MIRTHFTTPTAKQFNEVYAQSRLAMTPNANGSCKETDCSGLVVKKIVAIIAGTPMYSGSYCNICGKLYLSTYFVDVST